MIWVKKKWLHVQPMHVHLLLGFAEVATIMRSMSSPLAPGFAPVAALTNGTLANVKQAEVSKARVQ